MVPFTKEQKTGVHLLEARHRWLGERRAAGYRHRAGFTILVITGPNTGGKTVALKNYRFAQSGWHWPASPIPASEKSQIPVLRRRLCRYRREQSIEQTLFQLSAGNINITRIIIRRR